MINKLDLIGKDPTKMEIIAITDKIPKKRLRSNHDAKDAARAAAKGSQTARFVGVQAAKDSGRVAINIYATGHASGTTGTETMLTLRKASNTAAIATGTTFVNDVVLTPTAAWFTDSRNPVLYQVPLGRHGRLPGQDAVRTLPLSGAYQHVDGLDRKSVV